MKILISLFRIGLWVPSRLWQLLRGIYKEGTTLNALLFYGSVIFKDRVAFVQDGRKISYKELYDRVSDQVVAISEECELKQGDQAAILARNSVQSVMLLFALSKIGVHVVLLNPEMSQGQLLRLHQKYLFDAVFYEHSELIEQLGQLAGTKIELIDKLLTNATSVEKQIRKHALRRRSAGKIIVLTSGTTGEFRAASRQQRIIDFLRPLAALVNELQLYKFHTVYIPVPIYHGFGLAALIVSVLLGSEIHITNTFDEKQAAKLVSEHKIEVITVVPTMLNRMLSDSPTSLKNVQRILSGGAPLNPGLITATFRQVGAVLYNLYGTTEAGFCILGTPQDLRQNPASVGRAIEGVKIRVAVSQKEIGELEVKSRWGVHEKGRKWIKTGDLAFIDETKLVFLKGRTDSMIISGGENVYPMDLEKIMSTHGQIHTVAVIGVPDANFGARLKAFVVLKEDEAISENELR